MYIEYSPDFRLQHLIETYWVSDGMVSSQHTQRILPDGCVDILFNFNQRDAIGQFQSYMPHIVGTMTSYLDITHYSEAIQMLGIRFRPGGIAAFSRIPVFELTNQTVEIDWVETLLEKSCYDRLPEFSTMQERIAYLEKYLISRLDSLFALEQRINYTVDFIRKGKGFIPVKQVAQEVCLSERQLERKFKRVVGISPKMFSRIIRFKHTLGYLQTCSDEKHCSVAIDCGYFDHSHLIKDFKAFGGTLPEGVL